MIRAVPSLRAGVYVHHKGGVYLVLGTASHSERIEERYAVYFSLAHRALRVRPLGMFGELVNARGQAPRPFEPSAPRFLRLGLSRASRELWPEAIRRLTR